MQFIVDFHIHSKYSRATSKQMDLEGIASGCRKKGIDIVTCADFTHPIWFRELKDKLTPAEEKGLYVLKAKTQNSKPIRFILTTEISLIYKKGDRTRRLHLVVCAPDLETVAEINNRLGKRYNLKSDGRPILGLPADELARWLLKINPKIMIIPAHIWTPWFALFGSQSGFDSFEECFAEQAENIFAIETGLSSDPPMNWMVSQIDSRAIVSNSDAHGLENLGREANVFSGDKLDYALIYDCLRHQGRGEKLKLDYTIEFFPQEGKYHFDGHRACKVVMSPAEAIKRKNICPKCRKPMVLGVDHRVEELSDRNESYSAAKRIPFKYIIPLKEIVAAIIGVGKASKKVDDLYEKIIKVSGNEFNALLHFDLSELKGAVDDEVIDGIRSAREGRVEVSPGYDGEYGKVKVNVKQKRTQTSLF